MTVNRYKKPITIYLDPEIHRDLIRYAKRKKISLSGVVEGFVADCLGDSDRTNLEQIESRLSALEARD